MITLTVSDKADAARYMLGSYSTYWNPGATGGNTQYLDYPGVLISLFDYEPGASYSYDAGRLVQGKRPIGRLRDKGCTHSNISANLELTYRSIEFDTITMNSGSYPRARRTGTTQYDPYRAVLDWGDDHSDVYTFQWDPHVDSQGTFTRGPVEYKFEVFFDGNVCYIGRTVKTPITYRNGVQYLVGSTAASFSCVKRVGTALKFLKTLSLTGSQDLPKLRTAFAPYVGLAGTSLTSYTYDGVTAYDSPQSAAFYAVQAIKSFKGFQNLIGNDSAYVDFGDLALECADQMKYVDANLIMLVMDINEWRDFRGMWKNLVNSEGWSHALSAFKTFRKRGGSYSDFRSMFDPASSLYLFSKYAILPTVDDGQRIFAGVRKLIAEPMHRRLHSRKVLPLVIPGSLSASLTAVLTVDVGTYPRGIAGTLQSMIGEAKKWGIYPNCTALADTVKYSFVVNWFIRFSDTLSSVDAYLDMENYFPVDHCIHSTKWAVEYSSSVIVPDHRVTGTVQFSHYTRWITTEVPLPSVDPIRLVSDVRKHGVELTALFLQRLPKSLGKGL